MLSLEPNITRHILQFGYPRGVRPGIGGTQQPGLVASYKFTYTLTNSFWLGSLEPCSGGAAATAHGPAGTDPMRWCHCNKKAISKPITYTIHCLHLCVPVWRVHALSAFFQVSAALPQINGRSTLTRNYKRYITRVLLTTKSVGSTTHA